LTTEYPANGSSFQKEQCLAKRLNGVSRLAQANNRHGAVLGEWLRLFVSKQEIERTVLPGSQGQGRQREFENTWSSY